MSKRSLNEWRDAVHNLAKTKGFWDANIDKEFGTKIALIHSELSEALEGYRTGDGNFYVDENGKPEGVAVELIDALIRILDLCGNYFIDVDGIIEKKHNYNANRPRKHGKAF